LKIIFSPLLDKKIKTSEEDPPFIANFIFSLSFFFPGDLGKPLWLSLRKNTVFRSVLRKIVFFSSLPLFSPI